MAAQSWNIGELKITEVIQFEGVEASRLVGDGTLPDATPEVVSAFHELKPLYVNEQNELLWAVRAYVVRTPDNRLILLDTCLGDDKHFPGQLQMW
ncbi:MAG TPA: hypothetical protein VFR09_00115, partial [Alphaproteobacteria bacterium]|nr:hypothetical protein [Alphaproteobacteria bacterium]